MKVIFEREGEVYKERVEFVFADFSEFETNAELRECFEDLKIVELCCENSGLTEFPDFLVPRLEKCRKFELHKNKLRSLPNGLCLLSCKEFILCDNKLDRLPDDLELPACVLFSVGKNNLTELSKTLLLPNCKKICMVENKLGEWPEAIRGHPTCEFINVSYNKLESLPENMDFPECKDFLIGFNPLLKTIPKGLGLVHCEYLYVANCSLTSIPSDLTLPSCKKMTLRCNLLTELPENLYMSLDRLEFFGLNNNRLERIPDNLRLPKCKYFAVDFNLLQNLPDIYMPEIEVINLIENDIQEIPISFYEFRRLRTLLYYDNPNLRQTTQFLRFIDSLGKRPPLTAVWDNRENVHEHKIQMSLRESIYRIMSRRDLLALVNAENEFQSHSQSQKSGSLELLKEMVNKLPVIKSSNKEYLLDFISDETIHSTLFVKISDVLFAVLQIIEKDFNTETQTEIYKCLDSEIRDSVGKCFTGKITRIVNALNGFSSLVQIGMNETDFIVSVIQNAKQELGDQYTLERHIEKVKERLRAEKFPEQVIQEWTENIE